MIWKVWKASIVCSAILTTAVLALPHVAGSASAWGAAEQAETPRYVFVFTIDGARPDDEFGIQARDTPNIDALANEGLYSWDAITVFPSRTLNAVPSKLTGTYPSTHNYSNSTGTDVESLFEVFLDEGHDTLAIDGKNGGRLNGFKRYITHYIAEDYRYGRMKLEGNINLMSDFIDIWNERRPAFAYALLPTIDSAGHALGHRSKEYAAAIEKTDEAVGEFIDYLNDEGIFEESLIVITADHGMTGTSHGSASEGDMKIPLIIAGAGVASGELSEKLQSRSWEWSGGEFAYYGTIVDVAPTIAKLFGLRKPANAEGNALPVRAHE